MFRLLILSFFVFSAQFLKADGIGSNPFSCPEENLIRRAKQKEFDFKQDTAPNELKIVSYNVQNLFDLKHDEGKNDWEFLRSTYPGKKAACEKVNSRYREKCRKSSWTKPRYKLKLRQIRDMLKAQGDLPDLLALQEIENEVVIEDLAELLGYTDFVVTDSPDKRGIDVALLYNSDKVDLDSSQEYEMKGPEFINKPTRNILAVNFSIKGDSDKILGVYVNHWPSQAAPSSKRYEVAKQLKKLVLQNKRRYKKKDYHIVVTGDFNTIPEDNPNHPFYHVLQSPSWKDRLYDVHSFVERSRGFLKYMIPRGTYFYTKTAAWSLFDRFFVSANLLDDEGMTADIKSYRVVAPSFATVCFHNARYASNHQYGSVTFGIPWRYDHMATSSDKAGYSDHFPIVLKIKL
ncbi:MAG: endonuclease/exonuclease/phosphatase family protein [Bdellovibrionales bacterium]